MKKSNYSCVYNFKFRAQGIAIKNIIILFGDFLIMAISYYNNLILMIVRNSPVAENHYHSIGCCEATCSFHNSFPEILYG